MDEDVVETIVYQRRRRKDSISVLLPVRLCLTRRDIDNIMVYVDELKPLWKGTWIRSIEYGECVNRQYERYEQISRGGSLVIEDGEDGQRYTLNIDNFTSGLLLFLRNATKAGNPSLVYFEDRSLRVDVNRFQYEDWDAIIQYALFGGMNY